MTFMRSTRKQRPQRPLGPRDPRMPTGKRQGLNRMEVEALYVRQHGLCALGGEPLNAETMVVDHCHECAVAHGHDANRGCRLCLRGLVCPKHNSALGWLGDSADAIRRAAVYAAHGGHA